MSGEELPITIYVMPGSQYSAKVLVALDARKIPHYVQFVSTNPKNRNLPSGGSTVPEMTVGSGPDRVIVSDSELILHWLDEHHGTTFFPSQRASDLSLRASDKTLAGAVLFFDWVDGEGYGRSMRKTLEKLVPRYVPCFRQTLVDLVVSNERRKFRTKAAAALGLSESDLDDTSRVQKLLIEELCYFQTLLTETRNQQYFLPGDQPTAVDFSAFAQLERLVGTMGDADVIPSVPQLKKEVTNLSRLWQWHDMMADKHQIRFKGKRVPSRM